MFHCITVAEYYRRTTKTYYSISNKYIIKWKTSELSKNHQIGSYELNKVSLIYSDDKRYIHEDGNILDVRNLKTGRHAKAVTVYIQVPQSS